MQITLCPINKIPELQAFINTYWEQGHILAHDTELLCWQYRNCDDPDYLSVLIAEEGEKLLGFLGRIPVSFSCYGERLPAIWLAMWMVVPEARTQFVGLDLLRAVNRHDFQIVAGLGLNENTGTIFPNRGFEVYETIPRWVKVFSPLSLEKILARRPDGYPSTALQAWRRTVQNDDPVAKSSVRLVDWSQSTAHRWDSSWQDKFAPNVVGTWRDSKYLQWRYVDHPSFDYVLRFAENTVDGTVLGLLVYRVETVRNGGEKILRIVEFLTEQAGAAALANAVLEAGAILDVTFADFYCTSETFAAPLEAVGFVREDTMPAALPHLFQPLDFGREGMNGALWVNPALADDSHTFFRTGALYVTSSDGDQDRPN